MKRVSFSKGSRYYTLTVLQDLFEEWLLVRNYGRIGAPKGHSITEVYPSQQEAIARFDDLCHYREHKRHYHRESI